MSVDKKHILRVYESHYPNRLWATFALESHNVVYKAAIKHMKAGRDCIIDLANGQYICGLRAARYLEIGEDIVNLELAIAFEDRGFPL